jgi:muconolactone delta-isomerase
MEFLVELELDISGDVPEAEIACRLRAEAAAAEMLAVDGHLVRLWRVSSASGRPVVVGLYRADSEGELEALLCALPLAKWLHSSITPLLQHPNDPAVSLAGPQ